MRVVDREEFLKLPSSTFFCVWGKIYPQIKLASLTGRGEDFATDWLEADIVHIDFEDEQDNGESFELGIEQGVGRNGEFELEDRYLIYEKADLEKVIGILKECLEKAKS
jgi:hypothetical protein